LGWFFEESFADSEPALDELAAIDTPARKHYSSPIARLHHCSETSLRVGVEIPVTPEVEIKNAAPAQLVLPQRTSNFLN
jgi:pyruvate formate-lyase activating enzyme-like uncharacterized protein